MVPIKIKHVKYASKVYAFFKLFHKLDKSMEKNGNILIMLCTLCLENVFGTNCTSESLKVAANIKDFNPPNLMKHLKQHTEMQEVATLLNTVDDKK